MKTANQNHQNEYDVIVVGAGAAGIGIGILLEKLDLNYVILDKYSVGASFKKWPKETRFISPSFTGNFFKMPDLNAISPDSSPAYSLLTEHPSGSEYAEYLQDVSGYYELQIQNGIEVKDVQKTKDFFTINTSKGTYISKFVVWAAGEFQYPRKTSFKGSNLCTHYSEVSTFAEIEGNEAVVIGAYESGFDSAVNLVELGKKVTLIDREDFLELVNSDSSYSLSPFTRDRIKDVISKISYHKKTRVKNVEFNEGKYIVTTTRNKTFTSASKPIDCTGFDSSLTLVEDMFEFKDSYPLLTEFDESTKTENLFLAGPQVKHLNALFCFIYKYRQRFAIVAENIAKQLNTPGGKLREVIQEYKDYNFYLDDLSCCDNECAC